MTRPALTGRARPSGITRRAALALIGAALPLIGLCPTARAAAKKSQVVHVRIKNRKVVAPKGVIRVKRGDVVELLWKTDEEVRLHLHGYDIEVDVRPGKETKMFIRARVAGRFPINSHGWGSHGHGDDHGDDALLYLEVLPR